MRSSFPRRLSPPLSSLAVFVGCSVLASTVVGCGGEEGGTVENAMPSLGQQPTGPSTGPVGSPTGPSGPTGAVSPQPSSVQPTTPGATGSTAPTTTQPSGPTGTTGAPGPTGGTSGPSGGTAGPSGGSGPTSPTVTPTAEMPTEEMPDVDQNGKGNATPGSMSDVPQDYLRLGEIRILNNNWGSEDLGCMAPNSTMSVFVAQDGAFGWNFNRGDCAGPTDSSHPDFPQVEFGIHPFGIGSPLVTSPEFSSTTLLPLQISAIQSASVTLDSLNISLQNQESWNITFEFWLSEGNPLEPGTKVYAELMTWWGWDAGRWPCDLNNDGMVDYGDRVAAGSMEYTLCHQSDQWADGWRYFQFRAGDGSDGNIRRDFNGKVDVKALLDYLVNNRNYSRDLWLTRMEVGSEIDDNTSGTVSMRGITFEVNGENRSQVIGMPQ